MDTLTLFNEQIRQCQDDAYTLAWYLLGDEAEAEAATQAAVRAAYALFSPGQANCKLAILKQVLLACFGKHSRASIPATGGLPPALQSLPERERQALVLVDILNLSYPEAARVAGQPVREILHLLAQARSKVARLALAG